MYQFSQRIVENPTSHSKTCCIFSPRKAANPKNIKFEFILLLYFLEIPGLFYKIRQFNPGEGHIRIFSAFINFN